MRITQKTSDAETMHELGRRIRRCRIDSGLSQAELADRTGISAKTISNLEDGRQSNTLTFIRVLRALNLLEGLEVLVPPQDDRPTDFLRYNGKAPQRVSRKRHVKSERTWKWGDER